LDNSGEILSIIIKLSTAVEISIQEHVAGLKNFRLISLTSLWKIFVWLISPSILRKYPSQMEEFPLEKNPLKIEGKNETSMSPQI
jgi:hypothetical protein